MHKKRSRQDSALPKTPHTDNDAYARPKTRRYWRTLSLWLSGGLVVVCVGLFVLLKLLPCPHPLADVSYSQAIYAQDGTLLRLALTPDDKYRLKTRLEDIPPAALEAIIQYEDRYFWQHPGVNPFSLLRALGSMLTGSRRLGGSTITMQVARLAYDLHTGSYLEKLKQIFLALHLERHYSKAEILEAYFTLAPYGYNVEGLKAAALVYFHKSPHALIKEELLALTIVPQNPTQRRPHPTNTAFFAAAQRQWAKQPPFPPLRIYTLKELPFLAPHLCTELLQEKSNETIITTLVPQKQRLVEDVMQQFFARMRRYGLRNGAALLVHWPTMDVQALVGSADFFTPSIAGQIDGTKALRSPGSTLKPFIYALALAQGKIHPWTILKDTKQSFAGYDPENFDKSFTGPVPATLALQLSRNIPAITLAKELETPDLYDFLQQAGILLPYSREHYGLSLVLGGAELCMRDLAALYAMLANGGVFQPLRVHSKQVLPKKQLLLPEAAFVTIQMLKNEHAFVRAHNMLVPVYAKTGTSNGLRDAWTVGIVGPYVLVVWLGNFDNSPHPLLIGSLSATPLFYELAQALVAHTPLKDAFHKTDTLNVQQIAVCRQTGDLDISLCPQDTTRTWFIPGLSPIKNSGILRRIFINKETGLRVCRPDPNTSQEVVWEFWPSELARLFAQAGRPKSPPPAFEAGCEQVKTLGQAPRILLPKAGLTYYASMQAGGYTTLLLQAEADADVQRLRWFLNQGYVGTSSPGETLRVQVISGRNHLIVVDDKERSSTLVFEVKARP